MGSIELHDRRSLLPGLLGLAAVALLWWVADGWSRDRETLGQQIATTHRLLQAAPQGAGDYSALEARQQSLKLARTAWQERLADDADLQLVRARMFYDIRQRCYEVKLNCIIRLSEIEASGKGGSKATPDSEDGLSKLGVSRVRATVSGSLGEQELADMLRAFTQDKTRVWRFNRIQIKGRAFEIDLERHVVAKRAPA